MNKAKRVSSFKSWVHFQNLLLLLKDLQCWPSSRVRKWAVHKVRQHFLEGEGSKIEEKVMTDRYNKLPTWGRGFQNMEKMPTSFMDGLRVRKPGVQKAATASDVWNSSITQHNRLAITAGPFNYMCTDKRVFIITEF